MCTKHLKIELLMSLGAVLSVPVFNLVVAIILRCSLMFMPRLYNLGVMTILRLSDLVRPLVFRMLLGGMKPDEHSLCSVLDIAARNGWMPYTVSYWFASMCLAVCLAQGKNFSFTAVVLLLLWKAYFPVVVWIFAPDAALELVVKAELERRITTHVSSEMVHGSLSRQRSNVWGRLFEHKGDAMFACTTKDLDSILEYFEMSHHGVGAQRWPVWWHDDLRITGNTALKSVYLHDINIFVSRDEGVVMSDNAEEDHAEVLAFVKSFAKRVDELQDDRRE